MKKLLLVLSVVAMASFLFVGCFGVTPPVNHAPEITSDEVTSVTLPAAYTYTVVATDEDGDALTYSVAGPSGMTISTAGVINWTPTTAGSNGVIVTVSDGTDSDTQSFTIVVNPAPVPENHAPEITSIAVTSVTLPAAYTYAVVATDEDGDTLTYDLIPKYGFAPVGMTISSAGVISWTPTVADVGIHPVTVEVSDGELTDTQSFTVTVSPVPVGPTVVSLLPLEAIVGEAYVGQVTATAGDDATLTYSLVGAPAGMTIVATTGVISWTPDTAGDQVVTAVVTDGAGLSDTDDFTIVVAARVGPVITAIPDDSIPYLEQWTYNVVATPGTSQDLTYTLTVAPYTMIIDVNTGVITWMPIAVEEGYHPVIVKVTAADGLYDEEAFLLLVEEPFEELTATIEYGSDHSYISDKTYVRGYDVLADCVPVTVTLSEAVEHGVQIRWYDIDGFVGNWVELEDSGDGITFEGCLPFDPTDVPEGPSATWYACEPVCVEWRLFDEELVCCPEYTTDPVSFGPVYVDFEDPCASFIVTIEDCGICEYGAEMSWTTLCGEVCEVPQDCCDDYCSGVGHWTFTLDYDICEGYCDLAEGDGCDISEAFECGCLLYATETEVSVDHTVDVVIADNVGNEFTDTWTLTFDTDELTGFAADDAIVTDMGDGEWNIDYECTWDDCDECFPPVAAE